MGGEKALPDGNTNVRQTRSVVQRTGSVRKCDMGPEAVRNQYKPRSEAATVALTRASHLLTVLQEAT